MAVTTILWSACALVIPVCRGAETSPAASHSPASSAPRYRVDPFWPKQLPNNWMLGHVEGIVVDANDHVWVLHHTSTMDHPHPHSKTAIDHSDMGLAQDPPLSECCIPAPEVIEFDAEGNVVQAWGGHGHVPDWPEAAHGFWVDAQRNVWVTGNHAPDRHALKFSQDGKQLLLKIGEFTGEGGRAERVEPDNQNTALLGGPTGITVDDAAQEVYFADGNINQRVVVFDSNTGRFKRGWGAYGVSLEQIDNARNAGHRYDPVVPARNFKIESVRVSRDGRVYVSDKGSNRIQEFTTAGKFLREVFVARETLAAPGTTLGLGFSRDPGQKYLLVTDGSNFVVRVIDRVRGEVVATFGRHGRNAGEFDTPLPVAVDSRGNVYVGEVKYNNRIQKFVVEP